MKPSPTPGQTTSQDTNREQEDFAAFLHANKGLVFKFVCRYDRRAKAKGLSLDELEAAAIVAVWESWKDYDPTRGAKLTTWAANRVRWKLGALLRDWKVWESLPQAEGNQGQTLVVDIEDSSQEHTEHTSKQDLCEHLLRVLPSRQREVVVRFYGFSGREEQSLREIGDDLGVSFQRISQLLSQAIDKLRNVATQTLKA